MAKYKGTVELIGGLTPKNNGTFPLVNAKDIQVDDTGKRLDEKLEELGQCGRTVTVIVDGQAGTANYSAVEIYAFVQAGNTVVAILPDYANYIYQYDGYNAPTAANGMEASVTFIHTAVDKNGDVITDYIVVYDDKSVDADYYENKCNSIGSISLVDDGEGNFTIVTTGGGTVDLVDDGEGNFTLIAK